MYNMDKYVQNDYLTLVSIKNNNIHVKQKSEPSISSIIMDNFAIFDIDD